MDVRVVEVRMFDRFMHMRMRVRLVAIPLRSVPMLMVQVVGVDMRMFESLVCVPVSVLLG